MGYSVGDIVQHFDLPTAQGPDFHLVPEEHAATVVVWTCNHCPYALAWHDRIQSVIRDYESRDVAFVQVNANDADKYPLDSFDEMKRRVAAGELASPYARDEDQLLSKSWGAKVTPDVFVLDRSGAIVYRGAPDGDHDDPTQNAAYLRNALDDVLGGRPVAVAHTPSRGCSVKWIINDQPNPYL